MTRGKRILSIVTFAVIAASVMSPSLAANIDTDVKYQEIEGFGAAVAFYNGWVTAHRNVNEIYDIVFTDLRPSIFRIGNWDQDLGNPDKQKESDREAGLRTDSTIIAQGRKRIGNRFKILMCSWRIPEYMRVGNKGDGVNTLKKDGNGKYIYAQYGQWWKNSLVDYERFGIFPDWISIQNEPDFNYDSDQSSLLSAREGNHGNALYGPALKAVYDSIRTLPRRLNKQLKIIGPEALGIGYGNFNNYMSNLDTALLDGYAYHIYGQGNYENPDKDIIPILQDISAKWPNKPHIMTEFSWSNDKPEDNMTGIAWLIINHLVYGNLSAYIDWSLVWPEPDGEMVQIE
jgi:O-glycosyl hydrolase